MSESWQDYVAQPEGTPNRHLGLRFDKSGQFLPEAGNTVVAQVVPGSATEAALIWLRGEMMDLPFAQHFAFTDVASYHMTVFEGVIETRRSAGHWPPKLPFDTGIDATTDAMAAMLQNLPPLPGFTARPVEVTPFGLQLTGTTAADDATLRLWREVLATAFGYRSPGHDGYRFHTTVAYVHSWLPREALPDYKAAMARLTDGFLQRVPEMDLARPAFCRFADMNAFPPVLGL
jgi:hypothetical protein